MRYFRHLPLTFWAVTATALAVFGVFAWHAGTTAPAAPNPDLSITRGIDRTTVVDFRIATATLASLVYDNDPAAASSATALAAQARRHAAERRSAGAGADDALVVGWAATAAALDTLATDPTPRHLAAVWVHLDGLVARF